ncbi:MULTISPECIES: N-acetylglucosamine-6-phosphate deacetylase [Thermoanaerobacter]|jgi:N-acetylglucosamine-6-phosphate deacetylase|uniref:N-acetylglucosamine-6-phosphate deacetylase n=2 Tax=Thermoanaerobacter TaxID=1754 RepID=B0KDD5_THEP3|nr:MULTISPECIES: N-acetylglucosamine-6-phosphate deacetylase [Thermoanaerobacter]ABY95654.1 N-acetylglucosamine-6-phosphate deacetylase [Thermoanaerobacter pseudethanolicus ATCC 33223]ADV80592.1 N-acetylglucosamine-6-phosphate deacetylase [Thermoanaerobacter brockii subsp. finnii Ako-1]HBW59770.1 N-acetylglucosamine-6-phosphate deacetylase [Thermoanaerobacter sp.]
MKNLLLKHGEIYTQNEIIYNGDLLISNGKISSIGKNLSTNDAEVIDLKGKKIVPGFIDIHIHGGVGHDTMDATYEALNAISIHLAKHGVTSFCPTTMTMDIPYILNALKNINETMKKKTAGAQILGAYVEGPFISKEHKGAQDEKYIIPPDKNLFDEFLEIAGGNIKVIALAPEKDPDGSFVEHVTKKGVKVSLGHTNATYEEMKNGVEHGATIAVHTYNGMKGLHHREPGALGEVFLDDRIYSEVIVDFIHTHPASVKLLIKIKGTDKVILISDAMSACGLGDGEYKLGGQKVFVKNGEARLESGSLAGSTLTLDKAVKNITSLGVPLFEACKMASLNPAKAIGVDDRKGSIEVEKDADIVVLNNDLTVYMTIIEGKVFME